MDPNLLLMHLVVLASFRFSLTAASLGTCPPPRGSSDEHDRGPLGTCPPPRGSSVEHDRRPLAYALGDSTLFVSIGPGGPDGVAFSFKYQGSNNLSQRVVGNNNFSFSVFWEEEINEQLPTEAGSLNNQMDIIYWVNRILTLTDTCHEEATPVPSHYVDVFIEVLWGWRSSAYIVGIVLLGTLKNLYEARGIRTKDQAGVSRDSESTWTGETDQPENSRFAEQAGISAVAKTAATWLVASAATHHATANRGILCDFEAIENGVNIQAGDGVARTVRGRGSVITETVVLPDVWFVPGLAHNIVSASQLIQLDYSIVFTHGVCYIIQGATDGTVIGKASARDDDDGMFQLEFLKVPLLN